MIPFGLLSGFILFASGYEKEIRITELAEDGFIFRLAKNPDVETGKDLLEKLRKTEGEVIGFRVCFYDMAYAEYKEINLQGIQEERLYSENSESFYDEYQVLTSQQDYKQAVQRLAGQYNHYISLKLNEDDEELARELTGYPEKRKSVLKQETEKEKQADKTGVKVVCNDKQRKELFQENMEEFQPEIAVELDRPELYEMFLKEDTETFFRTQIQSSGNGDIYLAKHLIQTGPRVLNYLLQQRKQKKPDRIYIGNQFCPLLFPQRDKLFLLLEKINKEKMKITLSFSYLQENRIEEMRDLLHCIAVWCEQNQQTVEVVVNDWGMAKLVQEETKRLIPCLGVLLNKRKKDPRLSYKKGNLTYFEKNSLNAEFYREFLREEYGIQRYEWESCGYRQKFPQGKNSLHLPFYQTNTSQYCPVYAMCVHGERGKQGPVKMCPEYCGKYRFVYPEYTNLTGRFNSLFGIDDTMGESQEQMQGYLDDYQRWGIDRFVISLL